ncbi:hypothetical protein L2E82_18713 [Cichorium intybus]|uniref:Uncharacterized protein n=1 Tax=Cichorium intybus TaxID=13427 RepID=A0ACB9FAY7_CICIN|nr:hypothetical protein L2E82_18713 [Cichorium intybus]
MDMSPAWFSEFEMENTDQICNIYDTIDNVKVDPFSLEHYTENLTIIDQSSQSQHCEMKLPNVQEVGSNTNRCFPSLEPLLAASLPSSSSFTISFGDLKPKTKKLHLHDSFGYEAVHATKLQDNVLAERKRREKLNQHFISLSSLLPNRKKVLICFSYL